MQFYYEDYITYDNYNSKIENLKIQSSMFLPDVLHFGNYRNLTHSALCLYSVLVWKLKVSFEQGLYDETRGNALYLQESQESISKFLKMSTTTLRSCYNQLELVGLVDIVKLGARKVDKIYIKLPNHSGLTPEDIEKIKEETDITWEIVTKF